MKKVNIEKGTLDGCVNQAQSDRVLIVRNGNPVALIVGIEGLDEEQVQLGASDKFWKLIAERRKDKTLTRAALERKIKGRSSGNRH